MTGKMPDGIAVAQSIDYFVLVSQEEKNDIISAFLPDEDFPIDFPTFIDFNSLATAPAL